MSELWLMPCDLQWLGSTDLIVSVLGWFSDPARLLGLASNVKPPRSAGSHRVSMNVVGMGMQESAQNRRIGPKHRFTFGLLAVDSLHLDGCVTY